MTTYPNQTHASPHFSWAELDPNGLAGPGDRLRLVGWCTAIGEPVRAHFGKPVHITSGFRPTSLQARLWAEALAKYGSESAARAHVAPPGHSEHETGRACDFWIEGVTPSQIAAFLTTLPGVGGIGIYSSWVHADTRPRNGGPIARW